MFSIRWIYQLGSIVTSGDKGGGYQGGNSPCFNFQEIEAVGEMWSCGVDGSRSAVSLQADGKVEGEGRGENSEFQGCCFMR